MKTYLDFAQLSVDYPLVAARLATWIPREDIHLTFQWNIGGDVYVLESEEEYIKVFAENAPFDIIDDDYPEGMAMLAVINNNSGGPTWFIKRSLIEGVPA